MFSEDRLVPLSALQHWLYCPRQCALIHVEQAWSENRFTAEGRVLHERAHDGPNETRRDLRIVRGMTVRSLELGLSGQCDVVEFSGCANPAKLRGRTGSTSATFDKGPPAPGGSVPFDRVTPIEYKRGKPKAHRADEVQLCAQAMCLEEMLGVAIADGQLYYGERRRRTDVEFALALRDLVRETAASVHACLCGGETPAAEYEPRRCDACSLIAICQPHALRFRRGASAWFRRQLASLTDEDHPAKP